MAEFRNQQNEDEKMGRDIDLEDGKKIKDKYGFWRSNDFHKSLPITDDEVRHRRQKDTERVKKWEYMLKNWNQFNGFRSNKLKSRVRKGIPDSIRIFAWPRLAETENFKSKFRTLKSINNLGLDERVKDEVIEICSISKL